MMLNQLKNEMNALANPEKARILSGFFKTGPGQYGEGDIFLGITVPESRRIAKKYSGMPLNQAEQLLSSRIHEHRLVSILMLVHRFDVSDRKGKKSIADFYLKNTARINNWDLVDLSADKILGGYLLDRDRSVLRRLAKSENVWQRRIAIVSTYHFIKNNQFDDTLRISEMLLDDKHDLIQKAVGWMLREIGKKDIKAEEKFLLKHCRKMPRTMLRYAVERFPERKRLLYLSK